MSWAFDVPVGPKPDWETEEYEDEDALSSVAESFVLHQSLRHSRNTWLTEIFPKFSSKGKGKHVEAVKPPPHTLKFLAKCDVEIGPHIFHATAFYEATYIADTAQQKVGTFQGVSHPSTYGQQAYGTVGPSTSTSAPPLTSFDATVEVTPQLISQVNAAASTNPTLQNLLQQAAMGLASIEQLQTLGILIQTLAAQHRLAAQAVAEPSTPQEVPTPAQPSAILRTDIIFEFKENQSDRFKLPSEIVACEMEVPDSACSIRNNICLYTFAPFIKADNDGSSTEAQASEQSPVIIRIKALGDTLWKPIQYWVKDDAKKPDARSQFNEKVSTSAERVYLQHRLPQGDLLSQLQGAVNSQGFVMKSIKPSTLAENTKPKRSRPRKPAAPKQSKADGPAVDPAQALPTITEATSSAARRRKSSPSQPHEVQFINAIVPDPQASTTLSPSNSGQPGLLFDPSYTRFKTTNGQNGATMDTAN